MSKPLRMGAAAAVVSASVLLSRVLGLGREALLAQADAREDDSSG